jgi:alpha-tubulin suppressor-like RCC1 family protein
MPTFYNFRQNGVDYSFDDVFVPADLFRSGNLWTWGFGYGSQLGNASSIDVSTPVTTFAGGSNWKQVSCASYNVTAAIKTDGTLWVWGGNNAGQLGVNDTIRRSTPVTTFAGGTDWKQVSCGTDHVAAIKTDGTLWTWGKSSRNLFEGREFNENVITPITTSVGGTNWKQVSCGYWYTAAVKTDGSLWSWGYSYFGQLGRPDDYRYKGTPVTTFAGGTDWADTPTTEPEDLYTLSASAFYSVAIKTDGTLWTWGRGGNGQLGTNDTTPDRSTPVTTFAGGTNWKQVSSGGNHTAAIKTDGTLWTWGFGSFGRLGTNDATPDRSTPVTTFAGGTNWKQVSSGSGHVAAIKTDGTLWTWGIGGNGILGTNDTTTRSTPVTTFAGGTNWKQVSSGGSHTAAIKTDGTLWTWGLGTSGRLGFRVENNIRSTPVTTFAGGTNWADTPTTEPEDLYTLSAGSSHTAAIKTDGTLWTWGNMSLLGSELPSILTPVTTFAGGTDWADTPTTEPEDLYTLSAGRSHTSAIKTDGTLWTWGNGSFGRLGTNDTTTRSTPVTTFAGGTNWKQVSSGGFHTAAIKTDGTLWTWGSGANGRLGNRFTTQRNSPVTTFAGGTNWKQVSSGGFHTAAVKTDGTLWTWGPGNNGRLGNAQTTDRSTPVTTFAGGTDWKQVSSGTSHTAAIKTDGTLWTWGAGGNGRLGTNDSTDRSTPVTTFAGGTDWKQVSAGGFHTAAFKTDGTLWTWGAGNNGRLGTNDLTDRSTPVTTFAGGTDWKQVSIGYRHTAAVKTDGTLWTWGLGSNGRLGTNDTTDRSTPVTTFAGGTDWKQVSSGDEHIVALRDDGVNKELFVWGIGTSGQLGISNFDGNNVPNVLEGTDWKQVSAGILHASAIKTDGTLWTWGIGGNGILGTNDTTTRSTPVTTFAGGTDWKQVSSGNSHTAAIKTDGTLWTWGVGTSGRLGTNDITPNRSTPVTTFAGGTDWKQVSSGNSHTAAIKTDGTLWTWGVGSNGELGTNDITTRSTPVTTFAGGTNWKQVSAGSNYTAAIKTDGTLWTWGSGRNGRLGNTFIGLFEYISTPVTTFAGGTDWKQVSSGDFHTAAVKTDGTLWTWGNGSDGRLGTNDATQRSTPVTTFAGGTNWKQVNSGSQHTVALRDDGVNKELFVWGNGTSGQLGINTVIFNSVFTPSTTFAGGTDWKQVSAGGFHTAAVKTDGTLWTWGNGFSGRLGTNDTTERNTPVTTFAGGTDWKQVSAGSNHTAAIKTDGTLWTWGRGDNGELGNTQFLWSFSSPIDLNVLTPITTFAGGTDWKQISCGSRHTLAIRGTLGNYELFAFGDTYYGELGGAINIKSNSIPKPIFGNSFDWKQVDCGYHNTAAIKTDGTLWTWGRAQEGVLGAGGDLGFNALTPITTFAGGTNWKQVSVGGYYSNFVASAVKTDGTLWIWGEDQRGILGIGGISDNDDAFVSTPVTTFAGGTNWKSVSAGGYNVFGIKTDGTLWGWGQNYSSQLGVGDNIRRSTPVTTFAGGTNWRQIDHSFGYSTAAVTYEDPIL